ncbi:hypothetical protein J3B02_003168, partial [Coemansia erecta]
MHGLLVPSLDNRASMQSSRSSGQLSKQSRPSMFKHRRDSSLSTSASISSDHTRVLPFATAAFASHRLQPISIKGIPETPVAEEEPNSLCSSPPRIRIGGQAKSLENGDLYYPASGHPRFALAQPRRVVTVNGPAAMPAAAKTLLLSDVEPKATGMGSRPQCARTKRRSVAIGISSMLPSGTAAAVNNSSSVSSGAGGLSGARPRPIIGLGLTLNPADTLVTLQMRCRRNAQPRAVTDPQTAVAEFIKSTKDRRENQGLLKSLRSLTLSRTGTASTDNISIDTTAATTISQNITSNGQTLETSGAKGRKSLSLNNAHTNGSSSNLSEQRKVSRNSIHIMQKQKQKQKPASSSTSSSSKPSRLSRMLTRRRPKDRRNSGRQSGDFVIINESNPYSDSPDLAYQQQSTALPQIAAETQDSPFSSSFSHFSEPISPPLSFNSQAETEDNVPLSTILLNSKHLHGDKTAILSDSHNNNTLMHQLINTQQQQKNKDLSADILPATSRPTSRRTSKKLSKKKQQQQQQQQQQRRRSNSVKSQSVLPLSPSLTSSAADSFFPVDDALVPTATTTAAEVIVLTEVNNQQPIEAPISTAKISDVQATAAEAAKEDTVAQLAVLPEEESDIDTQTFLALNEMGSSSSSMQAISLGNNVEIDASAYAERCAMHPGTRNDLWCDDCEAAICEHCGKPGAHHDGHQVMKLSIAYDDTFESIEEVQLQLMEYLSETRVRSTLLDSALGAVSESYETTKRLIELQKESELDELDTEFRRAEQTLVELIDGCSGWRQHVEESVELAQKMAEEFTQAQAVAQRNLFFRVLAFATDSRPDLWDQGVPEQRDFSTMALPATMVDTLVVPSVLDLGRKRGHVRVAGDPFSAHGSVWKLEARRTRSRTGDSMLTVSATCKERGGSPDIRYTLGVSLVRESDGCSSVFAQTKSDQWELGSNFDFCLCSLDELQSADVLADTGCVTVRLSVDIASFKMLAEAQEDRIRILEQRIKDLESQQNSQKQQQQQRLRGGSSGESDAGFAGGTQLATSLATRSLRPDRRKRSDG